MFWKIMLLTTMLFLTYIFWLSSDFTEISAGIAIFLFGMTFLKKWFATFSGWFLEKILYKATNKTYKSLIFGFCASSVMQSSSVVTILTLWFLSAELIGLTQAIWIVFGSSIGTTTTAWFIAAVWLKINIGAMAFPFIVFGMIWSMQKSKNLQWLGSVFAWLGFVFLGIHFMKNGFESFQSYVSLADFAMQGMPGLLVFTWVGIVATILMQSSTAAITLVITALAIGEVSYENALWLVIGANIGTTITGILGSISSNVNGKRLAFADFSFKSSTAIICIIFFPFILSLLEYLADIIRIAPDNYTLRLALFHTLFNVTGVILLAWFIPRIAAFANYLLPDKKRWSVAEMLFITPESLSFPDTALLSLKKESERMYAHALSIFPQIFWIQQLPFWGDDTLQWKIGSLKSLDEIDHLYEKEIKTLYGSILTSLIEAETRHGNTLYEEAQTMKHANRMLISLIKNIGNMSPSAIRFLKSSNQAIKQEYEIIMSDIILALSISNTIRLSTQNIEKLEYIAKLERLIDESDKLYTSRYSKLVGEKHINQTMAMSLLNDTHLKKTILLDIFELTRFLYFADIETQVQQENTSKSTSPIKKHNKWIGKFRYSRNIEPESIIDKLRKKERKLIKSLKSGDLSQEQKRLMKEEIIDLEYALSHYHTLLMERPDEI